MHIVAYSRISCIQTMMQIVLYSRVWSYMFLLCSDVRYSSTLTHAKVHFTDFAGLPLITCTIACVTAWPLDMARTFILGASQTVNTSQALSKAPSTPRRCWAQYA